MEKALKTVTFEFADETVKVLMGDELDQWEIICLGHSDYLLPGGNDYVLASLHGGLVRGFVPPSAIQGKPASSQAY